MELRTKTWASVPVVRWFESNRAVKTIHPVPKIRLPFMPDHKNSWKSETNIGDTNKLTLIPLFFLFFSFFFFFFLFYREQGALHELSALLYGDNQIVRFVSLFSLFDSFSSLILRHRISLNTDNGSHSANRLLWTARSHLNTN